MLCECQICTRFPRPNTKNVKYLISNFLILIPCCHDNIWICWIKLNTLLILILFDSLYMFQNGPTKCIIARAAPSPGSPSLSRTHPPAAFPGSFVCLPITWAPPGGEQGLGCFPTEGGLAGDKGAGPRGKSTEHYRKSEIWIQVQTLCPSASYCLSSLRQRFGWAPRVSWELQWVGEAPEAVTGVTHT